MAFINRIVEHPSRVQLTAVDAENLIYDVDYTSQEGEVTQEGTRLNATEMNEAVQDMIDSSMSGITISASGTVSFRNMQSGTALVTVGGINRVSTLQITFPTAFENTPAVQITPITTVPNAVRVGVGGVTTTGFTVYLFRETAVNTGIYWTAIGM